MKKDNSKKAAKIVKKTKPLSKGVILKSAKNENSNRGAVAPHLCAQGASASGGSPLPKGEGRVRVFNLKRWHKLSAAFVLIAIIGIVVFFQFAPENARKAWAPAVALAVILTANFSRAIIKLVNPPRATERSCGVFICSLYSYNNG